MIVRPERPGDADAIRAVTREAFAGRRYASGTEAAIVDALRAAGALTLSLAAEEAGRVVGHIAFSPVVVGAAGTGWFGLGPVSVTPERQRRGLGGALIREGLGRLAAEGAAGCVLLGDPRYYSRFGFAPDAALRYRGEPSPYLQQLSFGPVRPAGAVVFHPAFDAA